MQTRAPSCWSAPGEGGLCGAAAGRGSWPVCWVLELRADRLLPSASFTSPQPVLWSAPAMAFHNHCEKKGYFGLGFFAFQEHSWESAPVNSIAKKTCVRGRDRKTVCHLRALLTAFASTFSGRGVLYWDRHCPSFRDRALRQLPGSGQQSGHFYEHFLPCWDKRNTRKSLVERSRTLGVWSEQQGGDNAPRLPRGPCSRREGSPGSPARYGYRC